MTPDEPADDLVIPPPRPDRPPLHANLLNVMQKANTALVPLFPYMHPGAIVSAGAVLIGGPDRDYGQFFHHNSVDEVVLVFVSRGGTLETGQVFTGGRVHGVNSFLKDPSNPQSFVLLTVTQRQREQRPQPEGISLICKGCRQQLFREDWDAWPPPDANEIDMPFMTLPVGAQAMARFNADPALRTCGGCGLVNEPFPLAIWGWEQYELQSEFMQQAKQVLVGAEAQGAG